MTSIWVDGLERSFDTALEMLAAAVRDCTNGLWETSMWVVPAPESSRPIIGPSQEPVTSPEQRNALVQRHSTPWGIAWHALEILDYDLNGECGPWAPPPPFSGHPHWRDLTSLPTAWSRDQMLGYVEYCRQRVRDTLAGMTDEKAARPLPPAHRYRGQPHARIITGLVVHTTEHAAQIRQFHTAAEA